MIMKIITKADLYQSENLKWWIEKDISNTKEIRNSACKASISDANVNKHIPVHLCIIDSG